MKLWPSGANRNWPIEPAAVARPIAHERRSGLHEPRERGDDDRERAAREAEADEHAAGQRERAGVVRDRHQRDAERVDERRRRRARGRRRSGRRSRRRTAGRAPRAGSGSRSRARTSRGPSRAASVSGSVNSPKLVRMPKVMIAIRQPATITTRRAPPPGDAAACGAGRYQFGSFIEPKRGTVRPRCRSRATTSGQACALARVARGRRRALDAADPARPVLRRPPLRRAAGPPRHPARGAQRAAGDARRAGASSSGRPYAPGRDELRADRARRASCGRSSTG